MKLFCVVLVVYVVALTLFGVDGRGGGTTKGLEESMRLFVRARRHAHINKRGLENEAGHVNNEEPPPPPHFRSRRNAMKMNNGLEGSRVTNEEPPPSSVHFRQRRQLPPPPEGFPAPPLPDGIPVPAF